MIEHLERLWSEPRRRDQLLRVSVAIWTLVLVAAFQPGLMTPDSIAQYSEGVSGKFTNWHPPAVSLLNGLAARFAGSPWPLLVAQLLAIAGGLALLVRTIPPRRATAAFTLFVAYLAAPPVWSIAVTHWKDVLLAAALLGAVVALRNRQPWWAFVWMLLAVLFRHNGIFAVPPLALYAAGLLANGAARRGALVALSLAVMLAAPKLLERAVRAEDRWVVGALLAWDVVGIYARHPELVSGSPFAAELTAEDARRIYTDQSCVPIFWGGPEAHRIDEYNLAARRRAITSEWIRLVRRHPGLYLKNRLGHLRWLLSLGTPPCYPFQAILDPNPWGFRLQDSLPYRGLRRVEDAQPVRSSSTAGRGSSRSPRSLRWP